MTVGEDCWAQLCFVREDLLYDTVQQTTESLAELSDYTLADTLVKDTKAAECDEPINCAEA